jgi:RecB family exonuclease
VQRVLRRAAARSDVEDIGSPSGGYRHRLARYRSGLSDEEHRLDVDVALAHVERALAWAHKLPRSAPLADALVAHARLAHEIIDDGPELGCGGVLEVLEESARAAGAVGAARDRLVDLAAVSALVERALERAHAPSLSVDDDDAVEILALPETWGRRFEHVVVAGCIEGKLPRVERGERLLADGDRARVNAALGRRVLRLLDDDPFEPSPMPRAQALEPLWMLGAIRAAKTSLLLTMPHSDGRGRELPASVFLLEVLRALGPAATRAPGFPRAPSPRAIAVRAAHLRARGGLGDDEARARGIAPSLLAHVDLCQRMSSERARFFFSKRAPSQQLASAPFAFAVDPTRIERAFAPWFGLDAARPLTPTRLEAMAECRMHGFLQHVLKVDVDPPAGNAADARVLGTLAHEVMELFFRERRAAHVPASSVSDADRLRVRALLATSAVPHLQGRAATGHLGAIRAQIAWLETALVRAVSMLARDPVVAGVEPVDFEVRIGTPREGEPGLASVPVLIGKRTVFLGGIIDRVDEGDGHRVVLDYKSSGTGATRRKVRADALFEKHFQLLVYLRLLEHHQKTPEHTALHGYLVSLRDGTASDDVTEVVDLRARILDDARPDGLAASIGRVILPILEGTLPPDAGDRCDTCRLQRVCRVPLAAEFAPDLDDPIEGTAP